MFYNSLKTKHLLNLSQVDHFRRSHRCSGCWSCEQFAGDYAGFMAKKPNSQYGEGREALLRATVDVVAEKGLRGMTFRAVADAAGVNNALIAHHFKNRQGLLKATLEWTTNVAISESELAKAKDQYATFEAALGLTAVARRKVLAFQYEMIVEASRNTEVRQPVIDLYRAYFSALMPERSSSTNPLTRAKFATLDGLVLQMVSGAITHEEFYESVHAAADWLMQPDPQDMPSES